MTYQFANNAVATLASGISNLATSITVATGKGALFPTPSGSDVFRATLVRASDAAVEIVNVTARSGDVMTVTRAQEGTTGLTCVAGDKFELRLTKAVMENVYQAGGTDVSVSDGGTGRSTGTTPYALIATGTTATGAQQTLEAGATTELLVGGGASALPVWTTATGSGSPVRATSPTLVTPTLGVATATSVQGIVGNVTPAAGTFTALTSTTSTTLASESIALTANNLPVVRPTLLLDFANSKVVDPRITFTRASTATRINASGLLETVASGTPRINYDPVTLACKGLLIEEARTNLLTYSEQFDNAAWTKSNCTVTANATTAPDGTVTADKLIESASNALHQIYFAAGTSFTSGNTYTHSVFAKAGERTYLDIGVGGSFATGNAQFNLQFGYVTSSGSATASITAIGNGWYRCTTVATANATTGSAGFDMRPSVNGSDLGTYTGDGTSGIYIWGAQLEAGSFATSYIPTTSAQVTRAADVATMTGANFSSWYRQDEGSFIAVSDQYVTGNSNQCIVFEAGDGTNAKLVQLGTQYGTTNFQYLINQAGSGQVAVVTAASTSQTARAVSYKTNDCAQSINGAAVSTDTAATMPIVASFGVGCKVNQISQLNGHIARIAYYPKRLTNATLQALSTP